MCAVLVVGCRCHWCVQDSARWIQWSRLVLCQVHVLTQNWFQSKGQYADHDQGTISILRIPILLSPVCMNIDPLSPHSLHGRCLWYQVQSPVFALSEQQVNAVRAGSGELSFLSRLPVPWVWQLEAQKSSVSPPKAIVHKAGVANNYQGGTAKKIEH